MRECNVLFLCTGNSARSIMAECALNSWGEAGSEGSARGVSPRASSIHWTLAVLGELNYEIRDLRSKSWDEFASAGSPRFDFVFTVCNQAAAEPCPVWPGKPITAHWGIADPAAFEGSNEEKRHCFLCTYRELENRIRIFINLDTDAADRGALRQRINEIGSTTRSESSGR
jgi:arsenate reductase